MKSIRFATISISIAISLLTISCTLLQPSPAPTTPFVPTEEPLEPAATVATVAVDEPTAEPTNTPLPTEEPEIPLPEVVAEVKTDGVSLFYDEKLFPSYTVKKVPATADSYNLVSDGFVIFYYDVPDLIRFELQTTAAAAHPAVLVVQAIRNAAGEIYPAYQAQPENDYQRFTSLASMIEEQPETAARENIAKFNYLDFSNGRGIRYLSRIPANPAVTTLTNEELYYIYEGVSNDGTYYSWLQYPISTDTLPNLAELDAAAVQTINSGDTRAWLAEQMATLDKHPASDFEPDLRRLDLMLETLFIAPNASTFTSIPSNDPDCLNDAQFVADVTIPDGTPIEPRTEFTKTWRLRNTGTCTWTAAYLISQQTAPPTVSPSRMRASAIPVIAPGEETEISLTFLAPPIPGYFRSEWQFYPPLSFEPVNTEPFGPIIYTEITVNRAAEVVPPTGTWKVTAVTGDNVPETLYEELIGQTVTFNPDAITFNDETCTGITYSGRFAYGNELPDFDDLVPDEITSSNRGYLELVRTTCDLPYFDQFIWENVPFDPQLLIRYGDGYYLYLRQQE